LLTKLPRLRRILLAYTVNELGTWFGYVALALGVYDHTHNAIATAALFVARGLLPALLAPVLVARVERSPGRGRLAVLYCVEGALALALAALLWRFSLVGVLVLVTLDGIAAVAATALVRACAAREAAQEEPDLRASPETAQRRANAALNVAFMFGLTVGPALGGLLVHALGGPLALVIDAGTFFACAVLLLGVRSHVHEGGEDSVRARMLAAWRHISQAPQLRVLLLTEAVAVVFFASVEPVEVIYAKTTLHAGDAGFGGLMGVWGAGAAFGALVFARRVQRPLTPLLAGGTLLVGIAYLGFALAPSFAVACAAAFVGGTGNGIQWPSLISAVQQLTPAPLHGRLMGAVGSLNALCPAIGFLLGGTLVALGSTRLALAVAGVVATLATIAFVRLPLAGLRSASEPAAVPIADPELGNPIR
jgi:MFS family permease